MAHPVKRRKSVLVWLCIAPFLFLVFQNCQKDDADEKPEIREWKPLYHFTTEKGVDCIKINGYALTCNWEAWNMKTNYGMYPGRAFDSSEDFE